MDEISFGDWLRRRRKALDLTQAELADRVGCSTAAIRKFESEERHPSTQIIDRFVVVLSIPPSDWSIFKEFARRGLPEKLGQDAEVMPWISREGIRRTNLPATSVALIGHHEELMQIQTYILNPDIRLVSLIGPLGIGKTRLSLEVAGAVLENFSDGVFFVALATLDNASLIASSIVHALGLVEMKECSAYEQLLEGIGNKHMLIVLDNCEHLIDEAARLTSELLSACPGLKILVTSREALRIPYEWLVTLPPLRLPPQGTNIDLNSLGEYSALTLFYERARAVRTDFNLNPNNLQTVIAICSRLDGLPLAIELIAARMRLMSAQMLLERMNDQFILSADGMRGVPHRQKTLQNAIGWSYDLLSAEEQKAFSYLSVFAGGFTLPAAENILGNASLKKNAADLVALLVDKSLLQRSFNEQDEPRFNMLFTIQQFALKCLRSMGGENEARDQHLGYMLEFAEKVDSEMHGPVQAEWIGRVEDERENIRVALDWCVRNKHTERGLRLLGALGWPWEIRSHYREMRNWFEKMRALPNVACYPAAYGTLLNHVGRQVWTQAHWEDARELLEESREIWSDMGEPGEQGLAEALNWLGLVTHYGEGNPEKAKIYLMRSRDLFQKWGNPREALSIFHLGILESDRGHYPEAQVSLELSLELFKQQGDLFNIARTSTYLGELFRRLGNLEDAQRYFEQHLRIDQQLQFWNGIADALLSLGNVARQQGEVDQAEGYYAQSLAVCREYGLIEKQPY